MVKKAGTMASRILEGLAGVEGRPVGWLELAERLGINREQYGPFREAIGELHRDARVVVGEDKSIHISPPGGRVIGTFRLNPKGFGFVVPLDPQVSEDLYVPAGEALNAVTGDLVEATVLRRRVRGKMRPYGQITRIVGRGKDRFVGTLFKAANRWMVQTDGRVLHQPITVDDVTAKNARPGDRVVVRLTQYPEPDRLPAGVVLEILGAQGEYGAELAAVIREFDLADRFGPEVEAELDRVIDGFNRHVLPQLADGKVPDGRADLRGETVITIDPVDARDFDDAISIKVLDDGWELGVHIADVSYFVREGTAIDVEARARGTSVYLPRRVLPMLPEALSNGLCSLQQGQDRLTKSAFIRFDRHGRPTRTRFANSVIRSTHRLTYEQATGILEGRTGGFPREVVGLLRQADTLARRIYERRESEGMLHLLLPEVELEYNEKGEVVDAHPADTSFSHTIIEMFMVEANEAVARLLDSYAVPFLRRIHDEPEAAALMQLREFMTLFGCKLPKDPDRRDLQRMIHATEGKPESFAVNYAVLRSLQKAEYSTRRIGHYALAGSHYCHFTSPIRRYPDLSIHRMLDEHFSGRLSRDAAKFRVLGDEMEALADHCSTTERRAESAERQLTETLVLQLLSQHIGQSFPGVVSGISGIGAFVQLQKFLIEGLVKLEELGQEIWELNLEAGFIRGRRSGTRIKIGDPMTVTLAAVDPLRRRLDLAPAQPVVEAHPKGKKKPQLAEPKPPAHRPPTAKERPRARHRRR